MNTICPEFETKLREITELSSRINKNDNEKVLDMMEDHITEIKERYHNLDDHWTIETADLIVLCYELLLLEKKDINEVFSKCLPRFDVKLKRLAENVC